MVDPSLDQEWVQIGIELGVIITSQKIVLQLKKKER